jgi:hypothetical protein
MRPEAEGVAACRSPTLSTRGSETEAIGVSSSSLEAAQPPAVSIRGLIVRFGATTAVDDISLDIHSVAMRKRRAPRLGGRAE